MLVSDGNTMVRMIVVLNYILQEIPKLAQVKNKVFINQENVVLYFNITDVLTENVN